MLKIFTNFITITLRFDTVRIKYEIITRSLMEMVPKAMKY